MPTPGGGLRGWTPSTVFSTPQHSCQIMYWGLGCILYTYDLHDNNFGQTSTVEKFNPQQTFSQFKHLGFFSLRGWCRRVLGRVGWCTCRVPAVALPCMPGNGCWLSDSCWSIALLFVTPQPACGLMWPGRNSHQYCSILFPPPTYLTSTHFSSPISSSFPLSVWRLVVVLYKQPASVVWRKDPILGLEMGKTLTTAGVRFAVEAYSF